jgi:single-stranded-DNA-specific exonuclease
MPDPDEAAWGGLLDLVALGTVADVVPLLGENRDLVRAGLRLLDPPARVGLRALWRVADLEGKRIATYHLGFHFGPRLNAAGRLGDAGKALRLLLTDDGGEAEALAAELDRENRQRQDLVERIYEEAVLRVERGEIDLDGDRTVVLAGRNWHEGVIGIVASRLVDRFSRPVLLVALDEDGVGRGSGRSIPPFDLVSALRECSARLARFGGHRMAAGFEVGPGHLEAFTEDFRRLARSGLTLEDLERELRIDACVTPGLLRHAGEDLIGALELLEPHGQGNPEPVLALLGVEFVSARQVGADKRHLKGTVMSGGHTLDVIGFGMGAMAPGLARAKGLYDIAFQPVVDEWADRRRLQLRLVDMRPAAAAAEVAGG